MAFETVEDLRSILDSRGWSPEELASRVGVSNMTWRRLLARPPRTPLPAKYVAVLERHLSESSQAPSEAIDPVQMVLSGSGATTTGFLRQLRSQGGAADDASQQATCAEAGERLRTVKSLPGRLVTLAREQLRHFPSANPATQALIAGGLLYFLNPFDLVADGVAGLGFLDDVGVLTLISGRLKRRETSEPAP